MDMEEKQRNPWRTIWTQPKATIAQITAGNPNRSIWWLATIYGFCSMLNMFQSIAIGSVLGTFGILLLALVIAPFYGYITFSVWSFVVLWVGKLFKGQGSFKTVRAAYAWSCVPITLNIPLWLLMVFLFGHQLFLNFPEAHLLPSSQVFLLFAILIVKVVLAIWSLVIFLNALAEVQKISVFKAILNALIAAVILGIVLFIFWSFLIYALGGAFASAMMILRPF